jgi:mRNA-degrading endonuclease toxin of MazEF toxin-antitoxin module
MPAPLEDLERGAVCLALFPFTFGFPLDRVQRDAEDELLAAVERYDDIEQIEQTISAGDEPDVIPKLKLRRVLVLQTGTDGRLQDVMVARVTSVKDSMRAKRGFYGRLVAGRHPTAVLLGHRREHGTRSREAYVNLINVAPIAKNAILRRVGRLDDEEMRQVTDRLLTSLELDISHRLGEAADPGSPAAPG